MTRATSLLQQSRTSAPGWDGSDLSGHEIKQWCLLIALPVVGMLLLVVCFLLQGVFAALGPVVIFVGVKLVTKKLEQTTSAAACVSRSIATSSFYSRGCHAQTHTIEEAALQKHYGDESKLDVAAWKGYNIN